MRRYRLRTLILALLLPAAARTLWGQTTRVDAANLVRPAGSTGNIQYNNTSGIGGSPNLHWDEAVGGLEIGQPTGGTGRVIVKGSNSTNTTYAFQGFDNADVERSRITNGGYFQGAGVSRLAFDNAGLFKLEARLQQPSTVVSTLTGGAGSLASFNGGFEPTSGNAVMNLVEVTGTVNQTGGANGKVRMLYLAANAVSAPNLYALETVNGYSLIGNGSTVPEVMPRLAVIGLGNTGVTNALGVYNTNGTPMFFVGDDGQAGIGTAAPAYSLDITGSDGIRLPRGTTAQRPTANSGVLRFNSTDGKFEGYDGSVWVQFGAGGSVISPAQLTANQNDWSPTGLSGASAIRVSTDATFRTLTGLAGGDAGRRLVLMNVGDYTLMLEDESTASAAANRFSFDRQDWFVLPGKSVELIYDGVSARWRVLTAFDYFNDYVFTAQFRYGQNGSAGTGLNGDYFTKANTGGGGSGNSGTPWGQVGITTGTSATGRGSIGASANSMLRSSVNTYLRYMNTVSIDAVSDATNTYRLRCGWMDNNNPTGEPSNGVFFRYTHGTNGGNWQLVARSAGSETVINTSVAPLVGISAPQSLIVSISPGNAAAEGYIDGVSVGEITTNIPTANMGYYTQIEKTVGTTSRTLYLWGANVLIVGNKRL